MTGNLRKGIDTFMVLPLRIFLRSGNVSGKMCKKLHNTFNVQTPPPENRAVYGAMCSGRDRQATGVNTIAHGVRKMQFAHRNTNTRTLFNPSAWGHLNPSSYCDVGRFFYGLFKLWTKLQRKK